MDRIEQLTQLFRRLDAGENPDKVRQEARTFLSTVGPREVAMAERYLIQAGTDGEQVRRRCYMHILLLPDQTTKLRSILPYNHIVRIILAEHEMMLCFLAELEELNREIQEHSYCSPTSVEMRKLVHIVSHIIAAGDHEFREAEVVFPELERQGYYGPPEIIKAEHQGLDACKHEIIQLSQAAGLDTDFFKFQLRLDAAVKYLVPAMREQIFAEDNILYPVAIEVITNKSVWDKIKATCEQIGYCGFDGRG
jgi:DUF438 domain-containing protein